MYYKILYDLVIGLHKILFVIIKDNILISLLITLIYYIIFISLHFWYTKLYLSIIENWFSYIILLKNTSAIILLLENILAILKLVNVKIMIDIKLFRADKLLTPS